MCIKEFISHATLKFLHQSAVCTRIPNWSKPIDEKQESMTREHRNKTQLQVFTEISRAERTDYGEGDQWNSLKYAFNME